MAMKEKATDGLQNIKDEAKVLKGEKGKDKSYSSTRDFRTEAEAQAEFSHARNRLFDVNKWSDIPGVANSRFTLYGRAGDRLNRSAVQVDDLIEIDLPGPFPMFWVRVVDVLTGDDEASFTVQPATDPARRGDTSVTDHFFHDKARSIFRVERQGSSLTAAEIGLNEAINRDEPEAGGRGVVNTLVSEGGWALFQSHQWKNLTDYLVGVKE